MLTQTEEIAGIKICRIIIQEIWDISIHRFNLIIHITSHPIINHKIDHF